MTRRSVAGLRGEPAGREHADGEDADRDEEGNGMGRMRTWKVTCERHNPQLGTYTIFREVEAMTAKSAVNKLNRQFEQFEQAERRGAYGWNVAISAEPA